MAAKFTTTNYEKVFTVVRFNDDQNITDADVIEAMHKESLRAVTKGEFDRFRTKVLGGRHPERKLAAFGNFARGPEDSGAFPGVPYLDTDGKIKVIENWTRGQTGQEWDGNWDFLFWQKSG